MKQLVIFGILLALNTQAQDTLNQTGSQDTLKQKTKVKKGFGVTVTQVQPQFPGGEDSLQSFLQENLVYPEKARLDHTQGRVYVGFLIDRKGKMHNPKILSGASAELDAEALRVVKLMPDWTPGSAGGTPVDVQYVLPIDFITPPMKKPQAE